MQWNDKQPIYIQLKDKVMAGVLNGSIEKGAAIPSIRQISTDYKVNPLTVSKAYSALVDDKIIEKKRGLGMFVKHGARERLLTLEKQRFLKTEWPHIKAKILSLGLTLEDLLNYWRNQI